MTRAKRFRALHQGPGAFIVPNPWDAGSARILAHARAIVEATDLPVSADLEKCFGDAPAAAAETARGEDFVLTARAENFLRGNPDLDDTIRRLQAFEKAGADVLFAPGLPDLAAVRTVCASLSKPVNFMAGIRGKSFSVAELEAAGVRRIRLATSLYRAAMAGLLDAAREVKDEGSFGYLERTLATPDLNRFMEK